MTGGARALAVWADIVKSRASFPEDLFFGIRARSADSRFQIFAEEVADLGLSVLRRGVE